MSFETVQDIVHFIQNEDVKFVDVRFTDVPGTEHHFSIPASEFTEEDAENGLAFDGSSIRGFTTIEESDMTLLPDPATAHIDPFRSAKTLNIKFFVHDPFTYEPFTRDSRNIARKAEEYLQSTGIADTCNFGAEASSTFSIPCAMAPICSTVSMKWTPMKAGGTAITRPTWTALPIPVTKPV